MPEPGHQQLVVQVPEHQLASFAALVEVVRRGSGATTWSDAVMAAVVMAADLCQAEDRPDA